MNNYKTRGTVIQIEKIEVYTLVYIYIYTNMDINYLQSITTTEIIHPCVICQ